ncbi:MAG: hypothetical protein WCT10_00475 [Patescibacteria group bacterium]|jgi:hypothetical protein
MFLYKAPSHLAVMAIFLVLVSIGTCVVLAVIRRRQRSKRMWALQRARELVRRIRQAASSKNLEQVIQVPVLVKLVMNLAEREGFELYETGASRRTLGILSLQARQTVKNAPTNAAGDNVRRQLPLSRAPSFQPVAAPSFTNPRVIIPPESPAGPVIAADGPTYIDDSEITVIAAAEDDWSDVWSDNQPDTTFTVKRFPVATDTVVAQRILPRRNKLDHEAGNLPAPEKIDELFENLILRDN